MKYIMLNQPTQIIICKPFGNLPVIGVRIKRNIGVKCDKCPLISCQKYLLKIQTKQDLNTLLVCSKQYDKIQYNI